MLFDSSCGQTRRLIALAVCAVVIAVALLASPLALARADAAPVSAAPVSAAWNEYLEASSKGPISSHTIDGHALGLIPSPRDPALTRGLRVSTGLVGALPTSFDLRTTGKLTPVRNQGSFGTCWSFASYGSLESCLLPGETRNFSEDNLVLKSGFGSSSATAATLYDMGGNYQMSTAYLARWAGPVDETDDAYGDSTTPSGLVARKHVQEVDWIPARASAIDNDNIKNALMTLGGVYVSFYVDTASTYYKASNASYYYNGNSTSGNHAVVIVGWDDDYAASNFATTPAGKGAFIVRNSWGTSWGSSGYFYVSYYDTCFGRYDDLAVFNQASATTNYTSVYQHDPLGATTSLYYGSATSGVGWAANVFAASSTATVTAVGFYTMYPGTSYQIYTGSTLAGKALNTSGTTAYMGYHTVTLTQPLSIVQGQSFVIAVKVASPSTGGTLYPIAIEYPITGYSAKATASAGQSYYSSNGTTWVDLTTRYSNTNACIKAFTGTGGGTTSYTLTTGVGSGSGTVSRNPDQTTYTSGAQVTLTATPTTGYTFTGWSGSATGSTNPLSVTMDADKTITANFQASGSSATTYEQNNALLVYSGTWSSVNGLAYSGSSYKTTNTAGSRVTASFTGTSVSYIARIGSSFGIAKVTLDNDIYYVDLYNSSTKYKQTVWSRSGLIDGPHTLVIERNGTRNTSSTGYTIDLDALAIVGTLTAVGSSGYTLTTGVGSGSGTVTRNPDLTTYSSGSQVTLTATPTSGYAFTGWSGSATGSTNPLTITMDANKTVTANFQASGPVTYTLATSVVAGSGTITRDPDQASYTSGALVTLAATPTAGYVFTGWGGSASGSTNPLVVTMSANKSITASFALVSSAVTRYEEDNALLAYSGSWSKSGGLSFSKGALVYTNYAGAEVTATFTGTAISLITRIGPTSGTAKITLDSTTYTVDLYSSSTRYIQTVWSATGLSAAVTHTLTIECTGSSNSLSRGNMVSVDALDITGTLLAP
jgi:uncharacterized repeat protein (TIGR02543 family)